MHDAIIRVEGLNKSFGRVPAVCDLDLDVAPAEFITLLGPSGCGKSTTLRMLGGFEMPTTGRIVLDGVDITDLPPNHRSMNMVFQDYALFPHMTVGANIAFGLQLKGLPRPRIEARVRELLDLLELAPFENRMPDHLSGGQRQRVALARALAPDPKVLLLDEPLGALDAKLRAQLQIELKSIQSRTGKTFIFVTHDQDEALAMSDRIIVMNAGRIEQDGKPSDLYRRPSSRFVAEFMGEANVLSGYVSTVGADGGTLDWDGGKVVIAADMAGRREGERLDAALRPEDIICSAAPLDMPNVFRGTVRSRIYKGSRVALDVETGGGILRATVDPFLLDGQAGDQVFVGWLPERVAVLHS